MEQFCETASDNTGYVLSYADGLYCVTDSVGSVVCEFMPDLSTVDAVPVVRCGECRYNRTAGCTHAYIVQGDEVRFASPYMTVLDYCSRGEPRTPPAESR